MAFHFINNIIINQMSGYLLLKMIVVILSSRVNVIDEMPHTCDFSHELVI